MVTMPWASAASMLFERPVSKSNPAMCVSPYVFRRPSHSLDPHLHFYECKPGCVWASFRVAFSHHVAFLHHPEAAERGVGRQLVPAASGLARDGQGRAVAAFTSRALPQPPILHPGRIFARFFIHASIIDFSLRLCQA
jgi:GNAT superfamily N-acetyltransferase